MKEENGFPARWKIALIVIAVVLVVLMLGSNAG